MPGLAQHLRESAAQDQAVNKLKKLADSYGWPVPGGRAIHTMRVFAFPPVDFPPELKWDTIIKYRAVWGGVHLVDVPVKKLVPCQESVTVKGVIKYIEMPVSKWNDDPDDVASVVENKGKFYVAGGHHRTAAAILLGLTNLRAELISTKPIS